MQDTAVATAYDANDVYQTLLAESERVGWPTAYHQDLTRIDREIIMREQPRQFVWVLRDYGTHLMLPSWLERDHNDSCREFGAWCWGQCSGSYKWLEAVIKTYPSARYYTYDHEIGLVTVTSDEAKAFLKQAMEQVQQDQAGVVDGQNEKMEARGV